MLTCGIGIKLSVQLSTYFRLFVMILRQIDAIDQVCGRYKVLVQALEKTKMHYVGNLIQLSFLHCRSNWLVRSKDKPKQWRVALLATDSTGTCKRMRGSRQTLGKALHIVTLRPKTGFNS